MAKESPKPNAKSPSKEASHIPTSVLVVEDDPAAKAAALKLLTDLGVRHVESAETSEAAWAALRLSTFDFVLLDWKLSPVSGAAILHRLRFNPKTQDIPVLVVSGVITKADFLFGEEYLLTGLVEKPYEAGFITRKIKDLVKESAWWQAECAGLEEAAARITPQDDSAVDELIEAIGKAPRPVPVGYGAARNLVSKGQISAAKRVLDKVLEWDGRSALALTLLGKIHLMEHNFSEAKKYLLQAHSFFPKNSERLVLLGDTHMNLLEFEQAEKAFDEAGQADPRNEKAKAGKVLAVATEKFFGQLEVSKSPASLPSLFNSIGVGLVHSHRFDDGFLYYQNALKYLDAPEVKGRVAFNLGLGYLRAQRNEEALSWFKKSDQLCGGTFQKPRDYIARLELGGTHEAPLQEEFHHDVHSDDPTLDDSGLAPQKPQPQWAPVAGAGSTQVAATPVPLDMSEEGTHIRLIQGLLGKLEAADSRLYGLAKVPKLERTHSAYSVESDGVQFAVFVPKTQKAEELSRPGKEATIKRNVFVFQVGEGGTYTAFWPMPEAVAAAAGDKKSA